jgi:hypothetical protein
MFAASGATNVTLSVVNAGGRCHRRR